MNRKWAIGLALIGLLAVLAALRVGIFSKGATDQQMIAGALADALEASKEGRSGPVLDFLSQQFQINMEAPGTRQQIARFVRDSHPEVTLQNKDATVSGDSAMIVTGVHVKAELLPGQVVEQDFRDVTLVFRRESSVEWLVIPTKAWRLEQVSAPGAPRVSDF